MQTNPTLTSGVAQARLSRMAFVFALLMVLGVSPTMAAHPISVTRTYVHLTREQATVKIEVFVEDLFLFHKLKPNDQDFLEPDVIELGIEKHKDFLLERFVIRDVAGEKLDGRMVDVKQFEMKQEGVPLAELMAHKLTFQIQYEFAKQPEFLTFSQHFMDEKILVPAEMRLLIKQENAGTPQITTLKPDGPQTFRFSWDNPALSPQASEEEYENWLVKQKEETLGITDYSSVYSFLYIDDREVRHEILIPLLTLEEDVLLARDDDDFLDVAEQDAARQQIEAFFKAGNPVEIDGVEVKPVVERCDFYGLDLKDFAMRSKQRPVSIANARVGIILSYSTKGAPSKVKVTWNRFNNYVWTVDMIVYAYDEASKVTLSRIGKNNAFQWQDPGRPPARPLLQVDVGFPPRPTWSLPIVSFTCLALVPAVLLALRLNEATFRSYGIFIGLLTVCAAASWPLSRWETPNPFATAPQVSDDEAKDIFGSLHKNTFRAFDYRDENDIYHALAKSVDGELLNDLYLQIRGGLEMQEQGGAVSRIREVKIVDGNKSPQTAGQDERGFEYRCRWTVDGTVEHWGHIHSRTNEYEAQFAVEPRDNAWKITRVELLDEKQVKVEINLRGL